MISYKDHENYGINVICFWKTAQLPLPSTSHLGQNVGLGRGVGGQFPRNIP